MILYNFANFPPAFLYNLTIDNLPVMWYTIGVKGEPGSQTSQGESKARIMKKVRNFFRKPLTNRPSYDTIRVQNTDGVRRLRGFPRCATPLVRVEFSHLWLVSSVESAKG